MKTFRPDSATTNVLFAHCLPAESLITAGTGVQVRLYKYNVRIQYRLLKNVKNLSSGGKKNPMFLL